MRISKSHKKKRIMVFCASDVRNYYYIYIESINSRYFLLKLEWYFRTSSPSSFQFQFSICSNQTYMSMFSSHWKTHISYLAEMFTLLVYPSEYHFSICITHTHTHTERGKRKRHVNSGHQQYTEWQQGQTQHKNIITFPILVHIKCNRQVVSPKILEKSIESMHVHKQMDPIRRASSTSN